MFFRAIAFIVGLIAVIAGVQNYDSELASAPVPVVTGALVMVIALFNLIPRIKRCPSCNKRLPQKTVTCPFCKTKQPPTS